MQAILFDFDYTLAEATAGTADCINYALAQLELPSVGDEVVQSVMGLSMPELYRVVTGGKCPDYHAEFRRHFIDRADLIMAAAIVFFDTVAPTMEKLRQSGYKLGIVSTRYRRRMEEVLKRDRLLFFFDIIVGAEDVKQHKPDPAPLLHAAGALDLDVGECLYVGDTLIDATAAQAAAMPFVGVTTGITTRKQFENAGVKQVIRLLAELPTRMEQLVAGQDRN